MADRSNANAMTAQAASKSADVAAENHNFDMPSHLRLKAIMMRESTRAESCRCAPLHITTHRLNSTMAVCEVSA